LEDVAVLNGKEYRIKWVEDRRVKKRGTGLKAQGIGRGKKKA
jgi:hypothetical protein